MSALDGGETAAHETAIAALEQMQALEVPPLPNNYAVFYAYQTREIPQLVEIVDRLIHRNERFSAPLMERLHTEFFGDEDLPGKVEDISGKIESAIKSAIAAVHEAGSDAQESGDRLTDLSDALQSNNVEGGLQKLIDAVVQETHKIVATNTRLEKQLSESTEQIDTLRRDLVATREEAHQDPLTGIGNRKVFDQRLRVLAQEARDTGKPMTLLLMDIDHFKRFNDTYGHLLGDQVLKLVAKSIKDRTKGQDVVARYGGEEFAVILPGTALVYAGKVAEDIRQYVSGKKISHRRTGEDLGGVTLSCGVAEYVLGEDLSNLIHRADVALYAAKGNGRNCVVTQAEQELIRAVESRRAGKNNPGASGTAPVGAASL